MICIGIVSVDENSSLEHSLSPSRSKFSSTGGDLGDELTPLHQAIGFHGNSRVISIFMAKFLSMSLSLNVKRFLGHSLSPLRSKISSNESEFRDRPHPLHEVLIWFRGNSGVFSDFELCSQPPPLGIQLTYTQSQEKTTYPRQKDYFDLSIQTFVT